MAAAAFFDLDRTLLRRSAALALAGAFRAQGLISRRQLVHAAAWQARYVCCGAGPEAVRRAAEDGPRVLAGVRPEELRSLVAASLEPVLRPLVYAEPLRLAAAHRARGERVYVISATLQEIAEAVAADLGFDGALGTVCEVRDGRYTGRAVRALHADAKAESLRELAEREGFDLARCTAYSDSHTDLPLLEAVGRPVAVNPDRALRRVAAARGWPVLEFREPAHPPARRHVSPALAVAGIGAAAILARTSRGR
ncbi:MAG TPA: HAD-IB family hydrolase [Gaiellaceae bacterium]|nr:HAD-IB family hydrolase [Gaiellaceae bacterium]